MVGPLDIQIRQPGERVAGQRKRLPSRGGGGALPLSFKEAREGDVVIGHLQNEARRVLKTSRELTIKIGAHYSREAR
ncbi:hypothetical protein TNCV_730641 [Trichonephila clavipes]|nr:hypothetical protein TNCV_730641 [Trichonephila clavipes]